MALLLLGGVVQSAWAEAETGAREEGKLLSLEGFELVDEPVAVAPTLKSGRDAIINGDYELAIRLLRPLAEKGDSKAQYLLSLAHVYGRTTNYKEALKWATRSAEQGFVEGEGFLGVLLAGAVKGSRLKPDYARAAQWLRKAAEKGLAAAQTGLGQLYADGHGVPKDGNEAVKWFRLAAEQGYAKGQALLAVAYFTGIGVSQDFEEAFKWASKAANQGEEIGQFCWAFFIAAAEACQRIMCRRICGLTLPQPRGMRGSLNEPLN